MPLDLGRIREARAALRRIAASRPELLGPSSEANRTAWEMMLDTEEDTLAAKKKKEYPQIVVRLSAELLSEIDRYVERLRDEDPGPTWTRSDAVRKLIVRALKDVEPSRGSRRRS